MFWLHYFQATSSWVNSFIFSEKSLLKLKVKNGMLISESGYQTRWDEGLPWWLSGKESICQCRRHGSAPWSGKTPHATEELSLCTTSTEPVLWGPGQNYWACRPQLPKAACPRAHALQQEKPPKWDACTTTREKPGPPQGPSRAKNKH